MPINYSGNGYLATDAGIPVDAFEGALKALRLVDRNDPAALVVANHIITFAKTGVLDPVQLRDLTLEAVRIAAPVTDRLANRNSGPPLWVINLVCGARLLGGPAVPQSNRRLGEPARSGSSPVRIARWDLQILRVR
jgi:hypothetical protein